MLIISILLVEGVDRTISLILFQILQTNSNNKYINIGYEIN